MGDRKRGMDLSSGPSGAWVGLAATTLESRQGGMFCDDGCEMVPSSEVIRESFGRELAVC